jgi:hypothetical protein
MHNLTPSSFTRARCALITVVALGALTALGAVASAQSMPPQEMPPGSAGPGAGGPPGNPLCQRLEGQLALIDRGGDPGKADQIRRYEDAAAKQQAQLDQVTAQGKRAGCESSGFFSIFSSNSAQCGPINSQIQQMRGNLDQINNGLAQLRGGGNVDRDNQRRSVLTALAQNNCGPQYAAAARAAGQQGGGFFNDLFNNNNPTVGPDMGPPSSTYKTVCVRTCDGFFFPVSPATTPNRFADDERTCKALCPAAEAALYAFRYPGEDINQAVSISGQSYTSLPNAFKYRQEFNPQCSCKGASQTWADALKQIDERATAAENGDIIVTDENARKMMQQGRPQAKQSAKGANAKGAPSAPQAPAQAATTTAPANTATPPARDGSDKPIRTVGPTFIQAK